MSGYFDGAHVAEVVGSVLDIEQGKFYFVPNPIQPALHARACDRIKDVGKGSSTSDTDIRCRRYLLIDLDPQRPRDISATDAEHDAAFAKAQKIREHLAGQGWPEPIVADSGNGAHLVFRVELPNDDAGVSEKCLKALGQLFDDPGDKNAFAEHPVIKVDTTTHNAARIWKLYGTVSCKGDSTPDRPHRVSRMLHIPEEMEPVPNNRLEELAATVPVKDNAAGHATEKQKPTRTSSGGDCEGSRKFVEDWLKKHAPQGLSQAQ